MKYREAIPGSDCLRATFPRKNKCSDKIASKKTYESFYKYWTAHQDENPTKKTGHWKHLFVERYDHDDGKNEYYNWFENEETHQMLLELNNKPVGAYNEDPYELLTANSVNDVA